MIPLYHAHIYLLNEAGDTLTLTAGAGEVGRKMVAQGWEIPLDREQSLVAQAARTRQGVIVNDVYEDPNFLPNELLPHTHSEMAVPLIVGDTVLGVLDVQAVEVGRFTDEDVNIQTTLAGQVAGALENVRLLEVAQKSSEEAQRSQQEVEKFAQQLAILNEIGEALSQAPDINTAYKVVAMRAKELVVNDRASATLLNATGNAFEVLPLDGEVGAIASGVMLPVEGTLVGLAIQEKRLLNTPDTRASDKLDAVKLAETGLLSSVNVPLVTNKQVIGTLNFGSKQVHAFAKQDEEIVARLGALLASTLENKQLLEETQKSQQELAVRSRELEASQQVTFAASEATDPDELLGIVVNLIRDQFNLYHAQVYLVDEAQQAAVLRESTGYAGRQLLKRNHQIPLENPSLVTRAIKSGEPVLVADVNEVEDWLPNELLPHTQAELVVPLKVEDKVLGALDVQSRTIDQLTPRTVALFQTMTEQIAFLFENSELLARLTQQAEAVRAANERFALAQESISLGVWDWNVVTNDLIWDEGMYNLYGIQAKDFGGAYDAWRQGLHPDDDARSDAEIQAALAGTKEFDTEFRVVWPDQSVHHLKANAVVIRNEAGTPLRMVGINYDITEQKQAEVALSAKEKLAQAQSRTLLELAESEAFLQGELDLAFEEITKSASQVLETQRTSIWFYDEQHTKISCAKLYELDQDSFSAGLELEAEMYPVYFDALAEGRIIAAHDAHTDPDTKEFSDGYLTPFGINSMLDAPIQVRGQIVGVVCHEHVGPARHWTLEEQSFALMMGDLVSKAIATHERRLSEEALQQANLVVESSPAILFRWRAVDGWPVELVSENISQFGYTPEELLTGVTPYTSLVHPDDLERVALEVQEHSANGVDRFEQEYRIITKDGQVRWTDDRTFIERDAEGQITHYQGIVIDITERKRAEEALSENRDLLEGIIDNSSISIYVLDTEGRFRLINNQFAEIFGLDKEAVIGKTDYELFPSETAETYQNTDLEILKQGKPVQIEEQLELEDGIHNFVTFKFPLLDSTGTPYALCGLSTDITERKRFEETLARQAAELETVAKVSTATSTILEADKLLQNVVNLTKESFGLYHAHIYLSDEAGDTLVLTAGAGEAGQQMVAEGWQIPLEREQSLVARAARSHEGVIVNDVTKNPNYLANPLLPDTRSEMAVPMIVGDKVIGVLDVQSDRTDRFSQEDVHIQTTLAGQIATALENARLYEQSLETAEKLREVDRVKSEFLANMSHELRTPLNSIIGYSEMMLMGLNGELQEEMTDDVQAIYDNGKHLLAVISDILDLAKIEAGRFNMQFEEVSVSSLLDEVKVNNAGLFMNKPLELIVEIEADLPMIEADPIRVNQIFNNLVSNAIKFTSEGRVTVRAYRDRDWVAVDVEDTGVGMTDEDLEMIFEKFMQVDGSFTRRAEGTGLGLAITRHLIHLHAGEIDVRSKLNEGTTFTVRLPLEHVADEEDVVEEPEAAAAVAVM